jgi:aspartyl-tRNA(Asn)/glutamyl-tRNA(Gln) amidotransferase subunit A
MHNKTLAEIASDLAAKEYSSVEITKHLLDRIKAHDAKLNSFITVTEHQALQQAEAADIARATGNAGPLTGVPIAQKDIFCTKGIKTSCASKMLDNFISPYDATVVTKFNQAGCVMLGKTNMDEFAMGSSNENSFYGPVINPWQENTVPGGSSGGSAAAVAARFAPGATGTDTGGSIRQPAALCGITGLKPTYGRVSRYGMIAFASSLDQGGPMTQTAEDAALMLNVMAGFDQRDSTSIDAEVPDYTKTLNDDLNGLTVGLPKEFFDERLSPEMAKQIEEVKTQLTKLGATFKEVSLQASALSIPAYYVIAPAECSSNLSRFDGVRFGYRCENPKSLSDLYERSRGESFGAEVKRRIMVGTYVLSAGYYDAYYLKALKIRRLIHNDFEQAFSDVDVILGPTTPTPAFKIGEKANDPISLYLSDIYTTAVNLAGLPGISIPCGQINNLPVGCQLIGPRLSEAKLLNVAHKIQQVTDWHKQAPAIEAN